MTTKESTKAADELARRGEQLIALGQEMLAEAVTLGAKRSSGEGPSRSASGYPVLKGRSPETKAQALYTGRRIRDSLFGAQLFGEPSWDILLDLFIAERRGKKLPVTTVCIGAQVPSTTALRYIGLLVECGFVQREFDPRDSRRIFLRLSPLGLKRMTSFFEMTDAMQTAEPPAVAKLRLASTSGSASGA